MRLPPGVGAKLSAWLGQGDREEAHDLREVASALEQGSEVGSPAHGKALPFP
jgi:hypothetical protein